MFDGRMLSAFPAVAQFVFASCLCTKSTEKQSLNRYFGCDDLVFKCSKHYINDMCMCGKRSSSLPKRIKFRQIFLITNWCCTFFFILRLHLTTRRCQKCKCQNGPKNLQFPQNIWGEGRQSTFETFLKINLFWKRQASLRLRVQLLLSLADMSRLASALVPESFLGL